MNKTTLFNLVRNLYIPCKILIGQFKTYPSKKLFNQSQVGCLFSAIRCKHVYFMLQMKTVNSRSFFFSKWLEKTTASSLYI